MTGFSAPCPTADGLTRRSSYVTLIVFFEDWLAPHVAAPA